MVLGGRGLYNQSISNQSKVLTKPHTGKEKPHSSATTEGSKPCVTKCRSLQPWPCLGGAENESARGEVLRGTLRLGLITMISVLPQGSNSRVYTILNIKYIHKIYIGEKKDARALLYLVRPLALTHGDTRAETHTVKITAINNQNQNPQRAAPHERRATDEHNHNQSINRTTTRHTGRSNTRVANTCRQTARTSCWCVVGDAASSTM